MRALKLAARGAWRGLMLRKGRAALMMLGVAVGIVTMTLVVSIGQGSRAKVEAGIQNFGPDAMMIVAGSPQTRGPGDERTTTLVAADLEAIRQQVPGLRVASPVIVRMGLNAVHGDRNTMAPIVGAAPDYEEAWDWRLESGEYPDESHEAAAARVVVLGKTVAAALFGTEDPVGQSIRIGDQTFRVLGVMARRGTSPMGMDMDNRLVVPLSTAAKRMFNVTWFSMIRARVQPDADIAQVSERLTTLLRERHHIKAGDTDDFSIRSALSFRANAAKMSQMLTMLLGAITVISLIAGAIVLASILNVAVAERRTEIALRRALGATRRQILQQFLVEGLVVTLMGGGAGALLGATASIVLGQVSKVPAQFSWQALVLAFGASVVVGLTASFLPARKAAGLEIVEAFRP